MFMNSFFWRENSKVKKKENFLKQHEMNFCKPIFLEK